MTACSDKELLLHGLLDGELDAANTLSCEAHIKECANCAAEFARLQALRSRLRTPGVAFEAPAALRARITAALGAPVGAGAPSQHAPARSADVVGIGAARSGGAGRQQRRWVAWSWGGSVVALAASLAFVLFVHLPQAGV